MITSSSFIEIDSKIFLSIIDRMYVSRKGLISSSLMCFLWLLLSFHPMSLHREISLFEIYGLLQVHLQKGHISKVFHFRLLKVDPSCYSKIYYKVFFPFLVKNKNIKIIITNLNIVSILVSICISARSFSMIPKQSNIRFFCFFKSIFNAQKKM